MKLKSSCWLLAAMAMLVASCSGKHELLETIPATSQAVIMVDGKELLQQLDCKITNGTIELPEYLSGGQGLLPEAKDIITLVNKSIDMENLAYAMIPEIQGEGFLTGIIKDEKAFADVVAKIPAQSQDIDGFKGVGDGGITLVYKDNQFWIGVGSAQTMVNNVKECLDAAKKKSIAKLEGVKDFLESDEMITMAVSSNEYIQLLPDKSSKDLEGAWILYSMGIKDNAIVMQGGMQRGDGRVIETPGTAPINDAVLAYVPRACNFVLAAGLTPQFPWDNILGVAALAGNQASAGLGTIIPYLREIDGTVLLAANAVDAQSWQQPSANNWQVLFMAHMPQQSVDNFTSMVGDLLKASGMPLTETQPGVMSFSYEGSTINFGSADGYLTVSNFPLNSGQQNELAPVMEGKNGAMVINLPSLQVFGPQMPQWGILMTAQQEPTKFNAKIELQGTQDKILPAVIQAFNRGLNTLPY